MSPPLFSTPVIFSASIFLHITLFLYGLFQDAYSPLKYTDIDYFVFTDAARSVSYGHSPYERETYRYTPLLAWLLLPTAWPGVTWFSFGKAVFAVSDVVAGWLIFVMLRSPEGGGMSTERAVRFASIWLLNPMVATISTRGSSEGLLGVMVVALLWAVTHRKIKLAGVLLGVAVHFKIYPFIYGPSIIWYLDSPALPSSKPGIGQPPSSPQTTLPVSLGTIGTFLTPERLTLLLTSLTTFTLLNALMYAFYSTPFLSHTYLHHLTRIDHRHNFSPYNTLLHLSSALGPSSTSGWRFERLAFIPQLFLSAVAIPLVLAKKDLGGAMLAQTFAFVAFNKVCTSQYFLWYLILMPFYLPYSSFLSSPRLGMTAGVLWVASQALWLHQAYRLEFLGLSTFVPGLYLSSLFFFAVNIWILGIIVGDIGRLRKGIARGEREREGASEVEGEKGTVVRRNQV